MPDPRPSTAIDHLKSAANRTRRELEHSGDLLLEAQRSVKTHQTDIARARASLSDIETTIAYLSFKDAEPSK